MERNSFLIIPTCNSIRKRRSFNTKLRQKLFSRAFALIVKYSFQIIIVSMFIYQETISRQIKFIGEEIELVAGDSTCTVNGLYWFKNTSPVSISHILFYPFVINEQLLYPDNIIVVDVMSNHQVDYMKGKKGVSFRIMIEPYGTALYKVTYTQETASNSMEYILLTTAKWKGLLEFAKYRIRIPKKYLLTYTTILFPYAYEQNSEKIFEICEEDYMPSTNFIIKWERSLP